MSRLAPNAPSASEAQNKPKRDAVCVSGSRLLPYTQTRRDVCARGSSAGKLGHAGQQEDDACGQHDEGREKGDHGFVSTKQTATPSRITAPTTRWQLP